jgi:hypothetical protein
MISFLVLSQIWLWCGLLLTLLYTKATDCRKKSSTNVNRCDIALIVFFLGPIVWVSCLGGGLLMFIGYCISRLMAIQDVAKAFKKLCKTIGLLGKPFVSIGYFMIKIVETIYKYTFVALAEFIGSHCPWRKK